MLKIFDRVPSELFRYTIVGSVSRNDVRWELQFACLFRGKLLKRWPCKKGRYRNNEKSSHSSEVISKSLFVCDRFSWKAIDILQCRYSLIPADRHAPSTRLKLISTHEPNQSLLLPHLVKEPFSVLLPDTRHY